MSPPLTTPALTRPSAIVQLSEVFRLIRKELDKFIDQDILTKEQAYDLANDWLAYDEFVEGMMYA